VRCRGRSRSAPAHSRAAIRPIARAVAFALVAGAAPAWAGPTGEQVVAGQASVSRAGASTLITQGTDRAAINWLTFDIGATESVRFAQPSVSSIALNRVLGQNPTEIFGSLSANGQVFILNPNGVLFGRGAQVDVGGLVAYNVRAIVIPDESLGQNLLGMSFLSRVRWSQANGRLVLEQ